jgi:LPXTG-motif cell wall-anchored protein
MSECLRIFSAVVVSGLVLALGLVLIFRRRNSS